MPMKKNLIYRIIALPIFVVAAIPFALIHLVKWCIEYVKRGKDVYALMKPVGEGEKAARELIFNLKQEVIYAKFRSMLNEYDEEIKKASLEWDKLDDTMKKHFQDHGKSLQ